VRSARLDVAAQTLVHVHRAVLGMMPFAAGQERLESETRLRIGTTPIPSCGHQRLARATTASTPCGARRRSAFGNTLVFRGAHHLAERGAGLRHTGRERRGRDEAIRATLSHEFAEPIPQRVRRHAQSRRSATIASRRLAGPYGLPSAPPETAMTASPCRRMSAVSSAQV
jgi:hypothetical protein